MKTLFESLGSSNIDDSKCNIFVIVKPGFFKDIPLIINKFGEKGWIIDRMKTKQLLPQEAERLYDIHKKEDWFEELCEYMSSEPTTAILFVKDSPMSDKMFKETGKIKDSIRKEFGESEMRNVIHSSDSLERLQIERGIYF
jgi:nucleoside diphosphate kinase